VPRFGFKKEFFNISHKIAINANNHYFPNLIGKYLLKVGINKVIIAIIIAFI
jgi:hypothetical protein